MSPYRDAIWILSFFIVAPTIAVGRETSFARNVKPFLTRYCVECHNGKEAEGGLNLETYASLRAGGEHGPVLVPGKADESRLVRMVEGKSRPAMPPKKSMQPKPEEKVVLRTWIDAGAKDDSGAVRLTLPDIKPKVASLPPITTLAYRPDGKVLVAGSGHDVFLIDPDKGEMTCKLEGATDKVTAVAFDKDGGRLAVASGRPGALGEVHIYAGSPPILPAPQSVVKFAAHTDLIHDLVFSPDNKVLATCSYDRAVKFWDAGSGKLIRELRDHSDAIYGIAFSPDGQLLASGAADRAVKIWDVATGKRLYTLGESTDWVYAVAWSPTGNLLAAAGVDRSIRVWHVNREGGRIAQSVFAHEGSVTRLAYSRDGRQLYSSGEDRKVKVWDTSRMVEQFVFPLQPDTPLALAVRPDQKQIAFGSFDGTLALFDPATGKAQAQPLPVKPKPPVLEKIAPSSGTRGQSYRLKLQGKNLADATELTSTLPGIKTVFHPMPTPDTIDATITLPPTATAGAYQLGVKTAGGQSATLPFIVDLFPPIDKKIGHDSPHAAQKVTLPATLIGAIAKAGDVNYFRFDASAGQEIGVQAMTSALGSKLEPVLQFLDGDGKVLAESENGLLGVACPKAGIYILGIRDREYRGDPALSYRLHVGPLPIVTGVFPLGVRRGATTTAQLDGVNLGPAKTARVEVPAQAEPGSRLSVAVTMPNGVPLGNPTVVVGEFAETSENENTFVLPVPGTANGRIAEPGATQTWRFKAKKGERLIVETNARRIGSPLDSAIEILDGAGQPLPLATLRSVAKTFVAFRDHDSATSGIRLETWSELAINDYLLVGNELVRIKAMPKNPDDDCQLFNAGGKRLAYLGTSPAHHPLGLPMYKVQIHPPGTTFPSNGLPLVTLYHRNDDGGPGYDKDSRIVFDPPVDGEYQVRVADSRGQGGRNFAYRLTVRPPRPSFTISFSSVPATISKGDGVSLNVTAERLDGFEDPIELRLRGLPPGLSAPATTIPVDENTTSFTLFAEPSAALSTNTPPLKLTARAVINGKEMAKEATGALPRVVEPDDLLTATDLSELTLRPGAESRLTVKIDRRNGFKGRVPVEVRGLPHGVRVLDIGLNGILITEKDSSRTVVFYAEPWVKPIDHPIVVLAKREGKNTEHAARSVLLRVTGK